MPFHQSACNPRGRAALPGRDDDAQAVVAATAHGSAPCIYHKADQEAKMEKEIFPQLNDTSFLQLSDENPDTKATN